MKQDLSRLAIDVALKRDWKQAIKVNLLLLKENSKDIDALNRLGRAFLETGQKTKSQEAYQKVLKLDKFNSIALKSLDLLKTSRGNHGSTTSYSSASAPIFLEEPGITKTVTLTRLGDAKIISRLRPGDSIQLVAHEHCVSITSASHEYVGRLPDDLASRMRHFLKGGNRYEAWVRAIELQSGNKPQLKIFIKEIARSAKFRTTPSFPLTEKLSYAAFTPPNLIHNEKPIILTPEEDQGDYGNRDVDVDSDENELTPMPDDD